MGKFKALFLSLFMSAALLSFTGCSEEVESPLIGKWAYIHDAETTIINLKSNGKVVYNGNTYDYALDDEYIHLTGKNGTLDLRYRYDGSEFLLYQTTEYLYVGEGTPDSILGTWQNTENRWSYEFTEDGTFNEDGYFPGYYTVDESARTVKLVYNDHFEDTVIYYTLSGNRLTIDYPWSMVAAE